MPDHTAKTGVGVYANGPDCMKCHYFGISWDPGKPYSCRLMGFKSRRLPALEVLSTDGAPCMGFVEKQNPSLAMPLPAKSDHKTPVKAAAPLRNLRSTQVWEA